MMIKFDEIKKIMVIGWLAHWDQAFHVADAFEQLGYEVFKVAANLAGNEDCAPNNYHILDEVSKEISNKSTKEMTAKERVENAARIFYLSTFREIFPVIKLLKKFQPDLIYICQHSIELDFTGVNIPIVYRQTEPINPRWCGNAEVAIFSATWKGAFDKARKTHTYLYNKCWDSFFSTFGYNPVSYPLKDLNKPYKHLIGFMGGFSLEGGKKDYDYRTRTIYNSRNRFLNYLHSKNDSDIYIRAHSYNFEKYIEFMHSCCVGINISGEGGCLNERTYHTPGMGLVLLQFEELDFQPLSEIGLIDYQNCLIFHDEKELDEKIQFIRSEPIKLEQIRRAGIEWAQKYKYPEVVKRDIAEIRRIWNDRINRLSKMANRLS